MPCLALLFLLALLPRLYSAQSLGWHWDFPGSFTLVNFDEGGSCRAALDGFGYSDFVGQQTIALASALGNAPPAGIAGKARAVKAYCHSPGHVLVARSYSAVVGALTVVVVAVLGLALVPGTPAVGFTAGALLALSGFHISQSHSGTVDAASTFFIYLFLTLLVFAVTRRSRLALAVSPVLLVAAVWTKYWVFAALAYLALLPQSVWRYASAGLTQRRLLLLMVAAALCAGLVSIVEFQRPGCFALLGLFYLLVPWRRIHRGMILPWLLLPPLIVAASQIDLVVDFTAGSVAGRFGTSYAAIGWHKLPRNLLNMPLVLLVGLGLPACLFIVAGLRAVMAGQGNTRGWWCLLPLLAFALFLAFVTPITYYRHYLPLIPAAALLAALGLYASGWGRRVWFVGLVLIWQGLLAVDLVLDYHRDPRLALRPWFDQHPGAQVAHSYYVNPPRGNTRLFRVQDMNDPESGVRRSDYLVLSENWYDTAFANELNGPLVHNPARLIKTRPQYTAFYRQAVAGQHPLLQPVAYFPVSNFMPELVLHKQFYGTFQVFVGDIRVYRVRR